MPDVSMLHDETLPVGDLLCRAGLLEEADLRKALAFQERFGGRIGSILVRMGALTETDLLNVLSRQLAIPVANEASLPDDDALFAAAIAETTVPLAWWLDQEVLPWRTPEGAVACVARDPLLAMVQETVERTFAPAPVVWMLAGSQDLQRGLEAVRRSTLPADGPTDIAHLRTMAEEAPVVDLVNNTLAQALQDNASDIHIEPAERDFTVRYRIDGFLQSRLTLSRERFDAVASRIKLIAGLNIAERRLPQDGRVGLRLNGQDLDIRVSTVPGVWGESIVLRLLPKVRNAVTLDQLGMEADDLERYRFAIRQPHGIVLVTGPTGSGKSTTLYATLEVMNTREQKIITVEDPVEYNVSGVTQIPVHPEIGYTFARALRALLRQDPDIIMIGEIRDGETADMAMRAALTGHLVFSTLHTNHALGAVARLTDMGVEPFLVASSVRMVTAQRLLRRLCRECAVPAPPPPPVLSAMEAMAGRLPGPVGEARWSAARGCPGCHGTGYRGRIAVHEIVGIDRHLRNAVQKHAGDRELAEAARALVGMRTLYENSLLRAYRGETTVDEVMRVVNLAE